MTIKKYKTKAFKHFRHMGYSWRFAAIMARYAPMCGGMESSCLEYALAASGYECFCQYDDTHTAYVNDDKNIVVLLEYDWSGDLKSVFVGRGQSAKSCCETFHRPFRIDGEAKLSDL